MLQIQTFYVVCPRRGSDEIDTHLKELDSQVNHFLRSLGARPPSQNSVYVNVGDVRGVKLADDSTVFTRTVEYNDHD